MEAIVERELQGYLAAMEEGFPVLEPGNPAIAVLVLGQVMRSVADRARAAARRATRELRRGRREQRPDRVGVSTPDARWTTLRLRFVRYLYVHGHIDG